MSNPSVPDLNSAEESENALVLSPDLDFSGCVETNHQFDPVNGTFTTENALVLSPDLDFSGGVETSKSSEESQRTPTKSMDFESVILALELANEGKKEAENFTVTKTHPYEPWYMAATRRSGDRFF